LMANFHAVKRLRRQQTQIPLSCEVNLSLCLITYHAMNAYITRTFLSMTLHERQRSDSCPDNFTHGEGASGTQWIRSSVGLRADLEPSTQPLTLLSYSSSSDSPTKMQDEAVCPRTQNSGPYEQLEFRNNSLSHEKVITSLYLLFVQRHRRKLGQRA
jgi:hypothetical protein